MLKRLTVAISFFFVAPSAAQEPSQTSPAAALPTPTSSPSGKIVLYRSSAITGAALGCPIRYKGREVVELGRGKYAEWPVPPGRYILTNRTSAIEVTVDPGETRYVRCQIKTGMLTGRADLQIIDEESFSEHKADYEMKEVAFTPGS